MICPSVLWFELFQCLRVYCTNNDLLMLNQLSSTRWRREAETGAEGHRDTYVKEKAQAGTWVWMYDSVSFYHGLWIDYYWTRSAFMKKGSGATCFRHAHGDPIKLLFTAFLCLFWLLFTWDTEAEPTQRDLRHFSFGFEDAPAFKWWSDKRCRGWSFILFSVVTVLPPIVCLVHMPTWLLCLFVF